MVYPKSPFSEKFDSTLLTKHLGKSDSTAKESVTITEEELQKIFEWLCSSPKITSYRVNTLKCRVEDILKRIHEYSKENLGESPLVEIHPRLANVIVVHSKKLDEDVLENHRNEIIIDVDCACAVLRGAHIYAPGVIGMLSGSQINDKVSIYADVDKKCKRGLQKTFEGRKLFIGNGILKMQRHQLFAENISPSGVAVQVTESISGCPPLGDNFLPPGWALLQNLPSMLCVLALNPQPNEAIIDLCASPGNKTTHIAEIMRNTGLLVAIDKTSRKVTQLEKRCSDFGAKVYAYEADSTKIVSSDSPKLVMDGPPFPAQSFDRVLLDAPCSVLGKRPQIVNRLSDSEIRSYVPLQRKLFESAVQLLKVGGTLVYSTCTITLSENEGMVEWALRKFDCLDLVKPNVCLGGPGWVGTKLTDDELHKLQRFGPDQDVDSVGFFFACFVKKIKM
ncbi:hypothetical protein JTB14_025990 [Gonioctena quinquepunctata]|nr:hypothetical protein JTB14_025990 [Gonioctena quinquepunctata]